MTFLPIEARFNEQATLSLSIGDIPLCGRKLRISKCVRQVYLGLDDANRRVGGGGVGRTRWVRSNSRLCQLKRDSLQVRAS